MWPRALGAKLHQGNGNGLPEREETDQDCRPGPRGARLCPCTCARASIPAGAEQGRLPCSLFTDLELVTRTDSFLLPLDEEGKVGRIPGAPGKGPSGLASQSYNTP